MLANPDPNDPHAYMLLYTLMDQLGMHPTYDQFRPVFDTYVAQLQKVAGRIQDDESMLIGVMAYDMLTLMQRFGVDSTPYHDLVRRALLDDHGALRADLFPEYSTERMYYTYNALCTVDRDCADIPGVRDVIDDNDHYLYDDEIYGAILAQNDPGVSDTVSANQLINALDLKDYLDIDQFIRQYYQERFDTQSSSFLDYLNLLENRDELDIVAGQREAIASQLRNLVTDAIDSGNNAEPLWQIWQARKLYDKFGVDLRDQSKLHRVIMRTWATGTPRFDLLSTVWQLGAAPVLRLPASDIQRISRRTINRFYDYHQSDDTESRMALDAMTVTALQENGILIPSAMLKLVNDDVNAMATDTGLFRSGLSDSDRITFESTANALTIKETIANQLTRRTS
ncbi:hypothetical protein GFD25_01260 [Bifidobacterium aerophilum]|uniref:Uncharacterized protein n=2 Tax=Bifidobacterium aerophilum TaxID=1798155 RepID=A0A6N9Z2V2_9BIFI|nr:hypothetical protein [Bifidobacterium aerophilum]